MDKYYVHMKVCPATKKPLTHHEKVVGHWEYKPLWRKVFLNERDVFIPKEEK